MSLTRAPLTTRRRLVAGLVATATALAITAVAVPASAAASPMAIPGTKPNWLPKAADKGATPSSSKITFGLLLKIA